MITDFLPFIPALIFGILAGIFTGLLPGIGPFQCLSLIYLLLTGWDPAQLMVFFIALITVSQFVDAIPAVYFGIPGETSSVPVVYEANHAKNIQAQKNMIKFTAISRTIGCVIALVATFFIIEHITHATTLFSSKIQAILLSLALLGILITSNNNLWVTLGLMLLGFGFGMIGYDFYLDKEILTFDNSTLYQGLPISPVLIGIYVIPITIVSMKYLKKKQTDARGHNQSFDNTTTVSLLPTILRSSTGGYLIGLIPGISYVLSSTMCYNFEKWLLQRKNKYRPGNLQTVVACETANSVGGFSSLLPLLFFGIPITISESLIYNLMSKAGAVFQLGSFLHTNINVLIISFIICVCVSFVLAWPLAKFCLRIFESLNKKKLYIGIIIIGIFSVVMAGYYANDIKTYLLVMTTMTLIGYSLRKFDLLPLIFVFIMQNSIESIFYNIIKIYL
jgi:putative tricarboxylic transport membrane protein